MVESAAQQNEKDGACMSHVRGIAIVVILGGFASAHAAPLTTPACLAKKLRAWGNLRKCQLTETGKAIEGKTSNLPGCQAKFDAAAVKLEAEATAAGIAVQCRYRANGDGTFTDYDTGLQWEQKTTDGSIHDVNNTYAWAVNFPIVAPPALVFPNGPAFTEFLGTLNYATDDPTMRCCCFTNHCDWRLDSFGHINDPAVEAIVGPTGSDVEWEAVTVYDNPDAALPDAGESGFGIGKNVLRPVRGVRTAW